MSLSETFPKEIPQTTRQIAEPMLRSDSVCRLLGEIGGDRLDEASLASMYSHTGRGGINPVLLCFVLALQFMENLPDREAALINADAKWVCQVLPVSFTSWHSQERTDYRLSEAQAAQALLDAGRDGFWLLSQIKQKGQACWQDLPEIDTLAQVLAEQFYQEDDEADGSGLQAKANSDAKADGLALEAIQERLAQAGRFSFARFRY